jgi:hypothetical protein
MLLTSWAGEELWDGFISGLGTNMTEEKNRAVTELMSFGVEHIYVRPSNVVWSLDTKKAMLVDFGCSEILKKPLRHHKMSPFLEQCVLVC